jgi:hypothetical protein
MRRISIVPADRLRRFVVVTNMPTNLPREIVDRDEDARASRSPSIFPFPIMNGGEVIVGDKHSKLAH